MKKNGLRSVRYNFIMNSILSLSSILFPLISFPYVSRVLGPEGTGKVAFATSIISYFAMLSNLGIPTYGVRACAIVRNDKDELSKTVQEILALNIISGIISYSLFFAVLALSPRLQADKVLYLVLSTNIFFDVIGVNWLYRGLERYTYITTGAVIFKVIAIVLMFAIVRNKGDYIYYGALTVFAGAGFSIFSFIYLRKVIEWKKYRKYQLKRHLKGIFVFFSMSVAVVIYTSLDSAMLGIMKSDEVVGYYNAAVKIKGVLIILITSLSTVLLPRLSNCIASGEVGEFRRLSQKSLNFVAVSALPVMAFFMIFAKESILFLSGNAYLPAVIPMMIIMPTVFFIGLSNLMGIQMLVPLGKEKMVLLSEVVGAVTDVIFNLMLIPKFGAAGAALGTLFAECMVFAVQFIALREISIGLYKEISWSRIGTAVLTASLVTSTMRMLFDVHSSFVALLCFSVIFFGVYFGLLYVFKEKLFREIVEESRKIFQKIIEKNR